ncbi:hypothetical protein LTR91_022919 [Friedmanniomyces endolithicus]|uniref:Uncharacterized protein n=1 Tax=Friedmanniomyces endolithicus TaxID=329885 RepID=A0AAN6H7M2_9PEZI|nr:hypothetical protein LTR57_016704 [Friedmanniomyces endolithicus]KAK0955273.1 hypothetical protein LTR91_022919 [Friedmanniomyces endolithicus]KAK0959712.1 hypothetical protein LTS01_021248 [Friedmanniomyces endolithicus]KAK1023733.1 hypothetical protein LTS16_024654 [Friedmanniomyces endolithicus]
MSRQFIQHYTRILNRWPVDLLRPEERSFQHLLRQRIKSPPTDSAVAEKEVNAAYLLLDNTYTKQFPLPESLMKPASNPSHYTDLARELDEAPSRTWFGNFAKRLKNMVRFNDYGGDWAYLYCFYWPLEPKSPHCQTPILSNIKHTMATRPALALATPLDYPPRRPGPDLEGVVVEFPLINSTSPEAAVGVLIRYVYELDALRGIPRVTISTVDDIQFDNAAFWVGEISIHTMSMKDLDAYHRFIYNPNDKTQDYWQELISNHLAPEHEKIFREEGFYLRPWQDRKFKRIPVENMTNLNKTALYEFQGAARTPNHMLPSPHQRKAEPYAIPAWAGAMREPGVDRGDDLDDLEAIGVPAASVKTRYIGQLGGPAERHGGEDWRRDDLQPEQLTDKNIEGPAQREGEAVIPQKGPPALSCFDSAKSPANGASHRDPRNSDVPFEDAH